jgi:molecular chaperone DnaJ
VVIQQVNTILGRIQQQAPCAECNGTGQKVEKYCGDCSGQGTKKGQKDLTITVPAGVDDGNRLRVRGEGDAGPKGGPPGDLYVFLRVKPQRGFRRDGTEIYSDISVSYLDAILGSTVKVETVDGAVDLKIPAGTQPDTTMLIPGKGAPRLNKKDQRGNQVVKVKVEIPKKISKKEKELMEQLKAEAN